MLELVAALSLFVALHSIPAAPAVRGRLIAAIGRPAYFGAYSVVSLLTLAWVFMPRCPSITFRSGMSRPGRRMSRFSLLRLVCFSCWQASSASIRSPFPYGRGRDRAQLCASRAIRCLSVFVLVAGACRAEWRPALRYSLRRLCAVFSRRNGHDRKTRAEKTG